MAFRKGSKNSEKLMKQQMKEAKELSSKEMLDFPVGVKYARDGHIWLVKEAFKDGPDEHRRVVATDSGTEEVMLLSILRKDAQSEDFTFIKEG